MRCSFNATDVATTCCSIIDVRCSFNATDDATTCCSIIDVRCSFNATDDATKCCNIIDVRCSFNATDDADDDLPVYRADAGNRFCRADALAEQTIADLPGEHRRVLLLVDRNRLDHGHRRDLRLRPSDDSRLDGARVIKPFVRTE